MFFVCAEFLEFVLKKKEQAENMCLQSTMQEHFCKSNTFRQKSNMHVTFSASGCIVETSGKLSLDSIMLL